MNESFAESGVRRSHKDYANLLAKIMRMLEMAPHICIMASFQMEFQTRIHSRRMRTDCISGHLVGRGSAHPRQHPRPRAHPAEVHAPMTE